MGPGWWGRWSSPAFNRTNHRGARRRDRAIQALCCLLAATKRAPRRGSTVTLPRPAEATLGRCGESRCCDSCHWTERASALVGTDPGRPPARTRGGRTMSARDEEVPVNAMVRLEHSLLAVEIEHTVHAMLDLVAPAAQPAERTPLEVALVLDRSGSMA